MRSRLIATSVDGQLELARRAPEALHRLQSLAQRYELPWARLLEAVDVQGTVAEPNGLEAVLRLVPHIEESTRQYHADMPGASSTVVTYRVQAGRGRELARLLRQLLARASECAKRIDQEEPIAPLPSPAAGPSAGAAVHDASDAGVDPESEEFERRAADVLDALNRLESGACLAAGPVLREPGGTLYVIVSNARNEQHPLARTGRAVAKRLDHDGTPYVPVREEYGPDVPRSSAGMPLWAAHAVGWRQRWSTPVALVSLQGALDPSEARDLLMGPLPGARVPAAIQAVPVETGGQYLARSLLERRTSMPGSEWIEGLLLLSAAGHVYAIVENSAEALPHELARARDAVAALKAAGEPVVTVRESYPEPREGEPGVPAGAHHYWSGWNQTRSRLAAIDNPIAATAPDAVRGTLRCNR
jgi:hypothetical protein